MSTTSSSSPSPQRELVTENFHRQLTMLRHGHHCIRKGVENQFLMNHGRAPAHPPCHEPFCPAIRQLLEHMTTCDVRRHCDYENCASSRQIIIHYKSCQDPACVTCGTNRDERGNVTPSLGCPTPSPPSANWRDSLCSNIRNEFVGRLATMIPIRQQDLTNPNSLMATTRRARQMETEVFNQVNSRIAYLVHMTLLMDDTAGGRDFGEGWKRQFGIFNRARLITQMVTVGLPGACDDRRIHDVIAYCKSHEGTLFERSETQEEYTAGLREKVQDMRMEQEARRMQIN